MIQKFSRLPWIRPRAPSRGVPPALRLRGARGNEVPLHAPVAQLRRVAVQVHDGGRRRRALARRLAGGGRSGGPGDLEVVAPASAPATTASNVDGAAEVGLGVAAEAAVPVAVGGDHVGGGGGRESGREGGGGGGGRGAGAGGAVGSRGGGGQQSWTVGGRRVGHMSFCWKRKGEREIQRIGVLEINITNRSRALHQNGLLESSFKAISNANNRKVLWLLQRRPIISNYNTTISQSADVAVRI